MKNLYIIVAAFACSILGGCRWPTAPGAPSAPDLMGTSYCMFDVSQDGKYVVFSGYGNGGKDLYMLNLRTNKVSQITNTPDYENYPEFSPDSKYFVYQKARNLSAPRYLFLRSLRTGHETQITFRTYTQDSSPSFSSDGKQIVFCRASNFVAGKSGENTWSNLDVYVINTNGTGLKRLTQGNYDCEIRPQYYPGNKFVLFESISSSLPNNPTVLSKVSTSGTGSPQTVVNFGDMDFTPNFFPGGKKIVFAVNNNGVDLYTTVLGSGLMSPVIPGQTGTYFAEPKVVLNGSKIYCDKAAGGTNLWEMNANGTSAHQVAGTTLFSDPMHWQP